MKAKVRLKSCLDAAMLMLFLLLMERHYLPAALHEWMGLAVFILFVLHNALNYRWYASLGKGRYGALRAVRSAVNFLLLLAMIGCIASSFPISSDVFSWMNIRGDRTGRALHFFSTAWVFVLMSVHLGLHWPKVPAAGRIKGGAPIRAAAIWLLRAAVLAVSAFGVYVFVDRAFYEELFLLTLFKDVQTETSAFVYLLKTAAMAALFVSIAYCARKTERFFARRKKIKTGKE